jgi:hypothetical protein
MSDNMQDASARSTFKKPRQHHSVDIDLEYRVCGLHSALMSHPPRHGPLASAQTRLQQSNNFAARAIRGQHRDSGFLCVSMDIGLRVPKAVVYCPDAAPGRGNNIVPMLANIPSCDTGLPQLR